MSEIEYKATFRFPTEQFAYIEVEAHGTPETLLEQYRSFQGHLISGSGITQAEFEQFVDNQLSGGSNQLETFQRMSPSQQEIVQLIKRSKKRVMYKLSKLEPKK